MDKDIPEVKLSQIGRLMILMAMLMVPFFVMVSGRFSEHPVFDQIAFLHPVGLVLHQLIGVAEGNLMGVPLLVGLGTTVFFAGVLLRRRISPFRTRRRIVARYQATQMIEKVSEHDSKPKPAQDERAPVLAGLNRQFAGQRLSLPNQILAEFKEEIRQGKSWYLIMAFFFGAIVILIWFTTSIEKSLSGPIAIGNHNLVENPLTEILSIFAFAAILLFVELKLHFRILEAGAFRICSRPMSIQQFWCWLHRKGLASSLALATFSTLMLCFLEPLVFLNLLLVTLIAQLVIRNFIVMGVTLTSLENIIPYWQLMVSLYLAAGIALGSGLYAMTQLRPVLFQGTAFPIGLVMLLFSFFTVGLANYYRNLVLNRDASAIQIASSPPSSQEFRD